MPEGLDPREQDSIPLSADWRNNMKDWCDMTIAELLDAGVTPERISSYAAEYYARQKQKKEVVKKREAAIGALNEYLEVVNKKPEKEPADETLLRWFDYLSRF